MSTEHLITFAQLQEQIEAAKTAALMNFEQWEQGTGALWGSKPPEGLRYSGSLELSNGNVIPMHMVIGYMAMLSGEPDAFAFGTVPVADVAADEGFPLGPSS